MLSGKIMSRTVSIIFLLVIGVISFGCNSLQSLTTSDTAITFSIEDISVVGQMQDVSVGGKATLPTNLQLVVSAVRPLKDFSGETSVEKQPLKMVSGKLNSSCENQTKMAFFLKTGSLTLNLGIVTYPLLLR